MTDLAKSTYAHAYTHRSSPGPRTAFSSDGSESDGSGESGSGSSDGSSSDGSGGDDDEDEGGGSDGSGSESEAGGAGDNPKRTSSYRGAYHLDRSGRPCPALAHSFD